LSSEQRNVAPDSDVNEKPADDELDGFVGPDEITAPAPGASSRVVVGAFVSTVHV
jgi:hypothetical protein